jgi:hypothetical protein
VEGSSLAWDGVDLDPMAMLAHQIVDLLDALEQHLILEQFMNEFLDASGKKYDDLTFAKKTELCEELKRAEIDPPIWKVLTAVNRLRNKIAHTFDHAEIQAKMDAVRAAYLAALTPTQAKGVEKLDDARIAPNACELCGGYLVVATETVRARKKT